MEQILCLVTARSGSQVFTKLLQSAQLHFSHTEYRMDADALVNSGQESIPMLYLFGDMTARIKTEQEKHVGSRILWHVYNGDWWGVIDSSTKVPEPYEGESIARFGAKELSTFPGGPWRFVYLMRDPRNHIHSIMNTKGEKNSARYKRDEKDYFRWLCKCVRNRCRVAIDNSQHMQNFLLVKYEDLVSDPYSLMSKVFAFCKISPNLEDLRRCIELDKKNDTAKKHSTFPSYDGSRDYWKKWSSDQKKTFKAILGKELVELGYEADQDW